MIRSRLVLSGLVLAAAGAVALVLAPAGTWAGWWTFRGGFDLLRWSAYLGVGGDARFFEAQSIACGDRQPVHQPTTFG